MKRILLIDLNWTYNRFYYIKGNNPTVTNTAIVDFFKYISHDNKFNKIFVVVDGKTPVTKTIYSEYKQGRSDKTQVYSKLDDLLYKLSQLKDFIVLRNDLAEADELIAYICYKHSHDNNITIYSGDKDLLQLAVYPNVQFSNKYSQGKFIYLTENEILNKFSNSTKTKHIDNVGKILTYKVLRGDSSDNIPAPVKRVPFELLLTFMGLLGTAPCFNREKYEQACISLASVNKDVAQRYMDAVEDVERNYKLISLLDFTGKEYIINNTRRVYRCH